MPASHHWCWTETSWCTTFSVSAQSPSDGQCTFSSYDLVSSHSWIDPDSYNRYPVAVSTLSCDIWQNHIATTSASWLVAVDNVLLHSYAYRTCIIGTNINKNVQMIKFNMYDSQVFCAVPLIPFSPDISSNFASSIFRSYLENSTM